MTILAIRGHATRGKEVIELLKMLGGSGFSEGQLISCAYFINNSGTINITHVNGLSKNCVTFTLEEFLEKFPYKIADRVIVNGNVEVINRMRWDGNEVIYGFFTPRNLGELPASKIQPYKEAPMYLNEKANKRAKEIEKLLEPAKEIIEEIIKIDIPKGYEFAGVDDDNQQVVFEKVKSQYPKTYDECCEYIGCDDKIKMSLIGEFTRLINARNAYWKIAGEQMGLDKPWEPDWSTEDEIKYVIEVYRNNVRTNSQGYSNTILAFPTAEMRDAFYENFKDLIEQCKELL